MTEQDAIRRFTALYEQTRSRVYAFAVSHAGRQLADEIVSEVYLVAWRRLADIPPPELPWLLAVARNVASQQFRSTVRQRSIAAELRVWTTEVELTAGDVGEQVAERQTVLAALAALSAPDRELLTLVAWHGLTPAEAARRGGLLDRGVLRPAASGQAPAGASAARPRPRARSRRSCRSSRAGGPRPLRSTQPARGRNPMNQSSRSRPGGRRADVLDLLASARPASLDPDPQTLAPAASFTGATAEPQRAGQPELPERPRRRAGLRIRLAGAGVVATGATAALVIALTGGPSGTAPAVGSAAGTGPSSHPAPTARAILLAAAVSAAKAPQTGKYWRVAIQSGSAVAAGPYAHPYAVMQNWAPGIYWDSRSPSRRSWTLNTSSYSSDLVLPGARAAWKAAGSPALPTAHAREQAWWQTGGAVGYFGNSNLTAARFRALPADSAGLAKLVRRAALRQGTTGVTQEMFDIYDQMLKWDPITPAVRAAVFRGLAALPGVRSAGRMTDAIGRSGYGIELAPGRGADRQVLIVAPGTGALLADEYFAVKSAQSAAPSGAVPGPKSMKCPAHSKVLGKGYCVVGVKVKNGRKVYVAPSDRTSKYLVKVHLGPSLALPAGAMDSYDVVLRAGWTDASPKLPPRSQWRSVATDGKG